MPAIGTYHCKSSYMDACMQWQADMISGRVVVERPTRACMHAGPVSTQRQYCGPADLNMR